MRWTMNPSGVEPGTTMPNLGIAEMGARHDAAILHAPGVELGPPHLLPRYWLHTLEGGG